MENIQQPIPTENILDSCSRIRIYFIEKLARNAGYKVYLFPNDATNDALSDYKTNFKHYVSNRDIVDYSQTEAKKETIQKLPIADLFQWIDIKTAIDNMPITNTTFLKPSDVSKKIIMTVVECIDEKDNSYAYLITKFAYNSTYKNKVRFRFVLDTYEKITTPVLTLSSDVLSCLPYIRESAPIYAPF